MFRDCDSNKTCVCLAKPCSSVWGSFTSLPKARGIVERFPGTESAWKLADKGVGLIQVSEVLEMVGPALSPRTGLARGGAQHVRALGRLAGPRMAVPPLVSEEAWRPT